jgi:hypothetical protein
MTPLPIPVPPQIEAVTGYTGDARWISVCWTCCGDCPWIDDGRSSMTGHAYGLLAWWRHPTVQPHLRDAALGSSEADGTQRVLIHRVERKAYLATAAEARRVVTGQWPEEPAVELTREEWDAVVERIRQAMLNRPIPSMGYLMKQMQEHSKLVAEMVRFLDGWKAE